jgi:hypothetical protein
VEYLVRGFHLSIYPLARIIRITSPSHAIDHAFFGAEHDVRRHHHHTDPARSQGLPYPELAKIASAPHRAADNPIVDDRNNRSTVENIELVVAEPERDVVAETEVSMTKKILIGSSTMMTNFVSVSHGLARVLSLEWAQADARPVGLSHRCRHDGAHHRARLRDIECAGAMGVECRWSGSWMVSSPRVLFVSIVASLTLESALF